MARAVMEGVSYSLKDCLDVLTEVGVSFEQMAVCGGGAKGAFWRGMIADVFGMPVTLMQSEESAVLGRCYSCRNGVRRFYGCPRGL